MHPKEGAKMKIQVHGLNTLIMHWGWDKKDHQVTECLLYIIPDELYMLSDNTLAHARTMWSLSPDQQQKLVNQIQLVLEPTNWL